jgi:hypothetical protein
MIDIDNLTVKELRELAGLAHAVAGSPSPAGDCFPFKPGDIILIQTVTLYYVGRVKTFDASGIVLADAAWVPNTGRLSSALATGDTAEAEPFPEGSPLYVARGGIISVTSFKMTLRVLK